MKVLTLAVSLLTAASLAARADVTIQNTSTMAAHADVTVEETDCLNNPGPWVTIGGEWKSCSNVSPDSRLPS